MAQAGQKNDQRDAAQKETSAQPADQQDYACRENPDEAAQVRRGWNAQREAAPLPGDVGGEGRHQQGVRRIGLIPPVVRQVDQDGAVYRQNHRGENNPWEPGETGGNRTVGFESGELRLFHWIAWSRSQPVIVNLAECQKSWTMPRLYASGGYCYSRTSINSLSVVRLGSE